MKPEIALAVYGDIDAVFSSFKRETLSGYMRIARSDLEKQYKKLNKKIEKMEKASRYDKAKKCFSDDDRLVPCVSYELAMLNLRAGMPDSYINMMTTTALDGDPRAITYCQDYFSTNSEKANPYSVAIEKHNIRLNGKFDFYEMFFYAIRGIGFDYSPYYPDSEIAIPGWEFGRVNIEIRRTEALKKLYQTLSYFVIPENIGTAEYKEHFGDFMPSELQIKIARHWFFIEDDRLVMSDETKKLRDEMKEKITNAVCNAPANAADTAKKTTSDVKTATAETPSESKSETAPQIFSLDLGDGDSYEGEMKDGKYHGMGTYRWGNGNVYTGVWENDDIIDSTKIEYPAPAYASESVKPATGAKIERVEYDNGSYEGEMVNGSRHGKGKYTWSNGSEYEGNWINGKRCGFGVYRSYSKNEENGTTYLSYIYEGEWKDSKQHGYGVAKGYKVFPRFGHVFMKWSYDGPWVDDKKHGRGVYRDWDGNALSDHWKVYEGEWIDDKRHGLFVWRPEPAAKDLKYIDYYEHGKEVVGYIDYDPSIKTLEDAQRAKETEREENERVMNERRAREAVQDCYNKAMQARNNRDYFRCAYYLHRGGLCGDEFYREILLECYHPTGATGYAYVENILTAKSLGNISDDEINICAFVLDKFVPKGTKSSRVYRGLCHYRLGNVKKAAGLVPNRALMFYEGRIRDAMEVMGGEPTLISTPYGDEIMARRYLDKVIFSLRDTMNSMSLRSNDPASVMRSNKYLQEKVLLAEAYVKFAKISEWQYQLTEIEEDLITLKSLMK